MEMLASKRGWPAASKVAALGRTLWLKYRTQKCPRIQITALRSKGSLKATIGSCPLQRNCIASKSKQKIPKFYLNEDFQRIYVLSKSIPLYQFL